MKQTLSNFWKRIQFKNVWEDWRIIEEAPTCVFPASVNPSPFWPPHLTLQFAGGWPDARRKKNSGRLRDIKPYFKIQVDLGHVTPRHPEPASLSARRRSSEHGDVPKSRITSSDPQSKGFFRIHIDSSWFMWILNWGNQIIDEWNRRFSFNAFISHGFILSVCWQYIIDSNSEHQQHHGTAWFHPHFLSDSPRISSLSISSKRTEIGFLAPHRAAYQGAPAWTWLHWYAKNLLRFLKASSSSFTAGNAGAPHLSAFGRSVVWWGKKWNVLDVGSDGLGGYENKGTSKSGGKDWNGYQTSNIITLIRQTTTCQLV